MSSTDRNTMPLSDAIALAMNIENVPHRVLVATAACTGMRLVELIALKRTDIDWTAPAVTVNPETGTAVELPRGRLELVAPRHPRAQRTIHLPPFAQHLLHWQTARHQSDHVFPNNQGGPMLPSRYLHTAFRPGARLLAQHRGLPARPIFHDLRRAHAESLLGWGVNVTLVLNRLGFANHTHLDRPAPAPADVAAMLDMLEFAWQHALRTLDITDICS